MSRMISVTCPNVQHCGYVNTFSEDELVSGLSIVDEQGNIVDESPPVTVDESTFVACEACGYPMSCADATISD